MNQYNRNDLIKSDITDGEKYKNMLGNRQIIPHQTITLTFNTDGAQPLKSKGSALWPIQAIINELDKNVRFQQLSSQQ